MATWNLNHKDAKVFLGKNNSVPLIVKEDIDLLLNSVEKGEMNIKAKWNEPISAPIQKGTEIGKLIIKISDEKVLSFPLFSGEKVKKQGFLKRIGSTVDYIIWGAVN